MAETGFRLPLLYDDAHQIRFYIWNKDQGSFYLDDMEIKIFTVVQIRFQSTPLCTSVVKYIFTTEAKEVSTEAHRGVV